MKTLNEAMHNLKEERYYYGEIEELKSNLKRVAEELRKYLSRCDLLQTSDFTEEYEYSQEQVDLLDQVSINLQNIANDVDDVKEKLDKGFPDRIRKLTPEEKAEIERMKERGEI